MRKNGRKTQKIKNSLSKNRPSRNKMRRLLENSGIDDETLLLKCQDLLDESFTSGYRYLDRRIQKKRDKLNRGSGPTAKRKLEVDFGVMPIGGLTSPSKRRKSKRKK